MSILEPSEQMTVAWTGGTLRIAGETHVGRVRRINQDAYGHFRDHDRDEILFVVADGLGGHLGGEVASRVAVESLAKHIPEGSGDPDVRLANAIRAANQNILTAASRDRTLDGMGTTIVCLLVSKNGRSVVANVGDSRLYQLRDEELSAVTEDHSLVATLQREGVLSKEEAREDPRRNQILRALGVATEVDVDIMELQPLSGDRYLLCSDGLHGLVEDDEIRRLFAVDSDPADIAKSLIEAANLAGGNDNITCLIVTFPKARSFPTLRALTDRWVARIRSLFRKANDS